MKMTVIGKSERNAGEKSKRTGKPYDGTTLHCALSKSKEVIEGQAVKTIYWSHLPKDAPKIINIGDVINVDYNQDGYIDEIEVIKAATIKA